MAEEGGDVQAFMIRLTPEHAAKAARRGQRIRLSPALWMRTKIIDILDGNDPAEYSEFTAELSELREEVDKLRRDVGELKTHLARLTKYVRVAVAHRPDRSGQE